jgi:hypothetical protein
MRDRLHAVRTVAAPVVVTAKLVVDATGEGFVDITSEAKRFVAEAGAGTVRCSASRATPRRR